MGLGDKVYRGIKAVCARTRKCCRGPGVYRPLRVMACRSTSHAWRTLPRHDSGNLTAALFLRSTPTKPFSGWFGSVLRFEQFQGFEGHSFH